MIYNANCSFCLIFTNLNAFAIMFRRNDQSLCSKIMSFHTFKKHCGLMKEEHGEPELIISKLFEYLKTEISVSNLIVSQILPWQLMSIELHLKDFGQLRYA